MGVIYYLGIWSGLGGAGMAVENSVFITKSVSASKGGGGLCPLDPHYLYIFSFYSFVLRKNLISVSSPGTGVLHGLQWLCESFCEPLHL